MEQLDLPFFFYFLAFVSVIAGIGTGGNERCNWSFGLMFFVVAGVLIGIGANNEEIVKFSLWLGAIGFALGIIIYGHKRPRK